MSGTAYQALTAYGVEIPKALHTRRDALAWAERHAHTFPGCRIVQRTARGLRTIWRHTMRPPVDMEDAIYAQQMETMP